MIAKEEGKLGVRAFPFFFFLFPPLGLTFLDVLPPCLFPPHSMPCFLSFISSKTEDWGYLNEDGELGLAYQGLKQVARSRIRLPACACSVCPACSCLRLPVSPLEWRPGPESRGCRGLPLGSLGWLSVSGLCVDEAQGAAHRGLGNSS